MKNFFLCLYVCSSIVLFIYVFPVIFTGINPPTAGELSVSNCTVLELLGSSQAPLPTKAAIWFAQHKTLRLMITVVVILFLITIQLVKLPSDLKNLIYLIVMWGTLGVFSLNLIGLICIIVTI